MSATRERTGGVLPSGSEWAKEQFFELISEVVARQGDSTTTYS